MQGMSTVVFFASAAAVAAVRSSSGAQAYETFRQEFKSDRPVSDSASYNARMALFEQRCEQVRIHNAQPGINWKAAVNQFADYTDGEFQALLGHRSSRHILSGSPSIRSMTSSSFLQLRQNVEVAQEMDWSMNLSSEIKAPKDQGACGSCWAVAAAGAIEFTAGVEVSVDELVECVENPKECGGKGGCTGATSELAFEYVHLNGIALKTGYQSGNQDRSCKQRSAPAVATSGFVRLATNDGAALLEAVATKGPVVVSADATLWGSYGVGVFDSCPRNSRINHAILCMGYGKDKVLNREFWIVRNSWGEDWGEKGFIRLSRGEDDGWCGEDDKPLDGVGCKGGPSKLPVCGMCGILSDSAYPTDVKL